MANKRNYNLEFDDKVGRRYSYNFDYDVMHYYFIRAMQPFFRGDDVLELGCFMGKFTQRLQEYFSNITCIEASDEVIIEAKKILRSDIKIINSTFEDVQLTKKYTNIIMTHVLEHIDDPIRVLKRIKNEWLSDEGKFFLVCPNANAPSRQIAVKMGLISHNAAVTPAEEKHGHKITYTFDTLEREVKSAGLNVVYRSGIFFKALANFQWDRLLNTDIISKEYLDGCYEFGQQYPDLCSSIYLVCQK